MGSMADSKRETDCKENGKTVKTKEIGDIGTLIDRFT